MMWVSGVMRRRLLSVLVLIVFLFGVIPVPAIGEESSSVSMSATAGSAAEAAVAEPASAEVADGVAEVLETQVPYDAIDMEDVDETAPAAPEESADTPATDATDGLPAIPGVTPEESDQFFPGLVIADEMTDLAPGDVKVDRYSLLIMLTEADNKKETEYTSESWGRFVEARNNAQTVYSDPGAAQEQIDAALAELSLAMDSLVGNGLQDITDSFPDPSFLAEVRSILDKPYGPIYGYDVAGITELYVPFRYDISSLAGLEHFVFLKILDCNGLRSESLDLSKNTELQALYCSDSRITKLDLSNNPQLQILSCYSNRLTELDLSNNIYLQELYCDSNYITELDLSRNKALQTLSCNNNSLSVLDVSGNTSLQSLSCSGGSVSTLNAANCTSLSELLCDYSSLTNLDVSNCTALQTLSCISMPPGLTTLDVTSCTALRELRCTVSGLSGLDVSKNTELQTLECMWSNLSTLDVSKNPGLVDLNCGMNQLSELDVSKNTELQVLDCSGNQLSLLDVSQNSELVKLECEQNQLSELDLSKLHRLQTLDCLANRLTSLDVTHNPGLRYLYCGGNQISLLDLFANTELMSLDCGSNQLSDLDVSQNTNLSILNCSRNQLSSLAVNNTELRELSCQENQLTSLDISQNARLNILRCQNNRLTALDVSQNAGLGVLECYDNQLTALDVSNNVGLSQLRCSYNYMTSTADVTGWRSYPTWFFYPQYLVKITKQPAASLTVTRGSITESLDVTAQSLVEGVTPLYQWRSKTDPSLWDSEIIVGATNASFAIPANLSAGTYYYYCEVGASDSASKDSLLCTVTVKEPEYTEVDKNGLLLRLTEAAGKVEADYTAVSWAQFTVVRDAAQAVYNDVGATRVQVDQALADLVLALKRLVTKDNEKVTVTVTANSLAAPYNGFAKSVGGYTVKWSDNNKAGAVLSGLSVPEASLTFPGSTAVRFEGAGIITIGGVDVTADYNIVTIDGLLTVNPLLDRRIQVRVTANSDERAYDGTEKSVSGYTVAWSDGNPGNMVLEGLNAGAVRTEPGTTQVNVTGNGVIKLQGFDVTVCFNIIKIPGSLTITE